VVSSGVTSIPNFFRTDQLVQKLRLKYADSIVAP